MDTYLKLFCDSLEKYKRLDDAEFGRLVRAGLLYKSTGSEPVLTGREELLWDGLKLEIDRDNKRYEEVVSARAIAGRKGAEARWQKDSKNSNCHLPYGKNGQEEEKEEEKEKEKDSNKNKAKRFVPPTVEQVATYCKSRGNKVDPQRFVDFYSAKGWMVGKNKMVSWEAAVRNWERDSRQTVSQKRNRVVNGYEQRSASEIDTTCMEVNFDEEI